MKLGDLVSYKCEDWMLNDFRKDHYGLGLVTWWDGCGKYKVLWFFFTISAKNLRRFCHYI